MDRLKLDLPFPVSANRYWRYPKGNSYPLISREGRTYRGDLAAAVVQQINRAAFRRIAIPVSVTLQLCPPDRRRRDLDNCFKVLFDALTHAGVWGDDSQIHRIEAEWGPVTKGGQAIITIEEY